MKQFEIEKYKNYSDYEILEYDKLYNEIYSNYERVFDKKYNLKLLLISDTHGRLEDENDFELFVKSNDFDLCVLLGDINESDLKSILRFINCYLW